MTDEELNHYRLTRAVSVGFVPAGKSVVDGGDFKTPEQGAATSVWCATSPQLAGMGGVYCQDVDVASILPPDSPNNAGVRDYTIDPVAAGRSWVLSEELTGGENLARETCGLSLCAVHGVSDQAVCLPVAAEGSLNRAPQFV